MIQMLLFLACQSDVQEQNQARERYNQAYEKLSAAKWDDASTIFLEARDQAGKDQQLRQDSAYNLAFSFAQQAMALEETDPERASQLYEQSIGWFQDAVRLNESAQDARLNLEIVLTRKRLLVDKLTQGENALEKRLSRLTEDLRSIREQLRKIYALMDQAGADSTRFRSDLEAMAVKIRELQADSSLILGLADDEMTNIQNIPEEERAQEQQLRLLQLSSFTQYLNLARMDISQARRRLRQLEVQSALQDLDHSLSDVKRAVEQLMSPIDVLGNIVRDQDVLRQQTQVLHQISSPNFAIQAEQEIQLPAWLTGRWLSEQQNEIEARAEDIERVLSFQLQAEPEEGNQEQEYLLQSITEALPPLNAAIEEMEDTTSALSLREYQVALEGEIQILQDLVKALENFSQLKQLIERAYRDHIELLSLLDSDEELDEIWERNQSRIDRLSVPLQLEKSKQLASIQASQEENTAEKQQEIEQFYEYAETKRAEILAGLEQMKTGGLEAAEVQQIGLDVQEDIEELRMMFFTIIEHLKDIAARQQTLLDQTTESSIKDYEKMLLDMQLILPEEAKLGARLKEATDVLAKQADALSAQGENEKAEQFGEASVETGLAQQYLDDVLDGMSLMLQDQSSSHDVAEILEDQRQSLEAVMRAIQILQPPQQDQGDEEQEQDQQKNDISQDQAQKKMQQAKEREAERAQKQKQVRQEPVAKDW